MRAPLALALVIAGPALAETPALSPERQTLEQFGAANAACTEWTDGCAVCIRHDDKTFACSLPGISCQPAKPSCNAPKAN